MRRIVLVLGAALASGLFTLWPLLTHNGIPSYQHDWSWAQESGRFRDGLLQMVSTWSEEGLGHPNPFATLNPLALFTVASGTVLPAKVALLLVLALLCIAAGTGVFAAARELCKNSWAAALAAFVYVASPVVYNKTSAGQIGYLEAYAAFAWLLYLLLRTASSEQPARLYPALALVSGLACVQPQFFIFSALAAVAFAFAMPFKRGVVAVVAVLAGDVLLNAPFLYAATALQSSFGYTVPHPLEHFEQLQSGRFLDAVRMLGYIVPYAQNAYARVNAPASAVLWLLAAAAAVGLFTVRDRRAIAVFAVGACGIVLCMGEAGPLAPVFAWGFAHVTAMTLLREFYHASVLTSAAIALGIACACAHRRSVTAFFTAAAAAALFPLALGHDRDLHFAVPSAGERAANAWIGSHAPGRVLPFPFKMPIAVGDAHVSGVDVFAYVDRTHMSAGEYGETPELDDVAALAADGRVQTARFLLERDSIRYVVWRKRMHSAFPLSLQYRGQGTYRRRAERIFAAPPAHLFALLDSIECYGDTCWGVLKTARPLVDAPQAGAGFSGWWPVSDLPGSAVWPAPRAVNAAFSSWRLSPADGWVPAAQWRWAGAAWALLSDPVAVTGVRDRAGPRLALPKATGLAYAGGPLSICNASCNTLKKITAGSVLAAPPGVTLQASAATAVGLAQGSEMLHVHPASVTFAYDRPWHVRAMLRSKGLALVVFRTRFDDGWSLRGLRVLRRVRVDAGFNGWVVDAAQPQEAFDITYRPQSRFLAAALLEICAYAALAGLYFMLPLRSKN